MRKVRKAWNGGSREAAMIAARKQVDVLIEQGAMLCSECLGEGHVHDHLCIKCRGAGCIVPPGGLKLPTASA